MDRGQYRHALSVNSTSPYYVLVTIVDDRTGETFASCVEAKYLKGAIYRELRGGTDLSSDDEHSPLKTTAEELALNNTDRVFHFSNPVALETVRPRYGEDELAEAREAVNLIGLRGLASLGSPDRRSLGKLAESAALAHAIIEHGALAKRGCRNGGVYAKLESPAATRTPSRLGPSPHGADPASASVGILLAR